MSSYEAELRDTLDREAERAAGEFVFIEPVDKEELIARCSRLLGVEVVDAEIRDGVIHVQVKADIELIRMEITRASIPTPYQEGKVSEKSGPHYAADFFKPRMGCSGFGPPDPES